MLNIIEPVGKMVLIDMLDTGLPSISKNAVSVKHNKMRCAYNGNKPFSLRYQDSYLNKL